MGLGKTLQSICILAGDHYEKRKEFLTQSNNHNNHSNNGNNNGQEHVENKEFLPSIIICPVSEKYFFKIF
jgi:SNF2 family DNA or RNA helicase